MTVYYLLLHTLRPNVTQSPFFIFTQKTPFFSVKHSLSLTNVSKPCSFLTNTFKLSFEFMKREEAEYSRYMYSDSQTNDYYALPLFSRQ